MDTRTTPFISMAGLYLTVGLVAIVGTLGVEAGVVGSFPRLRWVTIHLVTIGGVTQAVFGLLPSLVDSPTEPDARSRWLQWLAVNGGYPLVLIGMVTGSTNIAIGGATAILLALGLLVGTVHRRRTPGHELHRYYRLAPWFLVVGIFVAVGLLLDSYGPGGPFGSLEAHVHANVWGFLGLVVAGALLTLLPPLLETDLTYPTLVPVTAGALSIGATGLVAGPWLGSNVLTVAGLGTYVMGVGTLLANVIGTYRASSRGLTPRLALVFGGYIWLLVPVPLAPLVLLAPDVVPATAIETAAINGLVFGWMLQLAMAFLPLLTVSTQATGGLADTVVSVADDRPEPSWIQVGSLNAGVLALWLTVLPLTEPVTASLTLGGYGLIAASWTQFAISLWSAVGASWSRRRDGSSTMV